MMNTTITCKKKKRTVNIHLKSYLLKDMIIGCGQKIKKNQLMKKNQESSDKEESVAFSDMPPLEGDEEEVKGKGLEILTPNRLTRLPISLAQIKAVSNSCKLKNDLRISNKHAALQNSSIYYTGNVRKQYKNNKP